MKFGRRFFQTKLFSRLSHKVCLRLSSPVLLPVHLTLSMGDDDGSENVGKEMNLRSFKLNRVYLDPLNMSSAGDFSWRKENSSSNVHVLHKTAN